MIHDGLKIIEGLNKGKEILPIYCFYGDSYLIEEALQEIKAKVLSPSFKEMNYNSFDAKEADADAILSTVKTFPFMSPKRLVMVTRAESLSKSQQEAMLPYLQDPAQQTCLIFMVSTDKIDKRFSFFSELEKGNYLFHFKPPADAQLPFWVKKEAQRYGKKIADDAIGVFLEAVGSELMDIRQEIEKLTLFVGDKAIIEKKDVDAAVSHGRIDTVFDLADSLGRKDLREGMINLKKLMEQGEEPVKILGLITRQFRMIWRAKALKKNGASVHEIARSLGIYPSYLEGYLRQGKGLSDQGLSAIFQMLHHADISLKSGRQSSRMVMERLIIGLCSKENTV